MKLANVGQRLALVDARGAMDLETISRGAFDSDPQAVYERWSEFTSWVAGHAAEIERADARPYRESGLGAPVPAPRQVFAIGLNYRDHAAEAGLPLPERDPVVFAKFPASVTGPGAEVELPSNAVDYEAELVVVIGTRGHRVAAEDGWSHVAGLTLGQDISERVVQFRGPAPQFSLGKSYPGFSPTGPVLVTPDEFADADNIGLGCTLNGRQMQKGRTSDMVFSVPQLIESLSAIVPLLPGDLIFTGTPAGIGWARDPKVTLRGGDRLVTHAEVIGEMTTTFTTSTP
jgi:2-keto-4-pentenoate hydratase/2-oxohepta-3-ene-1,7-dioic acid hydratase in catechol pathway